MGHPSPVLLQRLDEKQDAGVANGPGKRGSGADGWKGFAGELLCACVELGEVSDILH
jgi:hypothetical protein